WRWAGAMATLLAVCIATPCAAGNADPAHNRIIMASLGPATAGDRELVLRQEAPGQAEPSLPEMIGQMLLVSFSGTRPAEEAPARFVAMTRAGRLGGVVFLSDNIVPPPQVRTLNAALMHATGKLPPFICVDQEGGTVKRLTPARGFVGLPGAAAIATMTLDKAFELDERAANELADLGFNVNFGPVVDLNTNPQNPIIGSRGRSYAADPDRVIAYARRFIDAHEQAGILTVAKHFPGHGSSATDPHLGIVDVSKTWREDELIPYVHLIDRRLVDMIMVGHLIVPAFSDGG